MLTPRYFTDVINFYLPEPNAQLVNGIVFGTQLNRSTVFYEEIRQVGLLHMVVLSGTNITILASIIGGVLYWLPKKLAVIVTICVIVLFTFFVGAQAPIIRASIMGIIAQISILYKRKNLALYSLFLSGIFTAVLFPKMVGSVSFALSYGATLGIILFGSVSPKSGFLWRELKPSLAAQVFTVPIIYFHFRQVSLIAPLANLFTAWVVPAVMCFGFLASILGKINLYLGRPFSFILMLLSSYLIFVIHELSSMPFSYFDFSK